MLCAAFGAARAAREARADGGAARRGAGDRLELVDGHADGLVLALAAAHAALGIVVAGHDVLRQGNGRAHERGGKGQECGQARRSGDRSHGACGAFPRCPGDPGNRGLRSSCDRQRAGATVAIPSAIGAWNAASAGGGTCDLQWKEVWRNACAGTSVGRSDEGGSRGSRRQSPTCPKVVCAGSDRERRELAPSHVHQRREGAFRNPLRDPPSLRLDNCNPRASWSARAKFVQVAGGTGLGLLSVGGRRRPVTRAAGESVAHGAAKSHSHGGAFS